MNFEMLLCDASGLKKSVIQNCGYLQDELGIVGFSIIFSSVGKTGDAGAGAGLVSRDCFSLKQTWK